MNATFQFANGSYTVYTNGKIYANGIQYVEVKHGYQVSRGQWDHETGSWKKRLGFSEFDKAVAIAAGFIKSEPAECEKVLDFGKYEGKKLSEVPVSYLCWLSIHSKVLRLDHRSFSEAAKVVLSHKKVAMAA